MVSGSVSQSSFLTGQQVTVRILYSVNPKIKLQIQQHFFEDVHYVWCAAHWDGTAQAKYSTAATIGMTSNPQDLYIEWRKHVARADSHFQKPRDIRDFYVTHGLKCVGEKTMSQETYDELVYFLDNTTSDDWAPLLYLIPWSVVESRVQNVQPAKRSSRAMEYIIADLAPDEFDIVEIL